MTDSNIDWSQFAEPEQNNVTAPMQTIDTQPSNKWNEYAEPETSVSSSNTQNSSGLMGRVGKDMSGAMQNIGNIWQKDMSGDINPASAGVQILGNAATGAVSPITEGVKSAYNSLPNMIRQPINNTANSALENIRNTYNNGINKVSDTNIGQYLADSLMNSPHTQKNMQEISDDAKAATNILSVSPATSIANNAIGNIGKGAENIGNFAYNSGKAAEQDAHNAFVQNLVLPKETAKVSVEQFGNSTEKGINQARTYQPSPYEKEVAQTVAQLPIKSSNSVLTNYNIIRKANSNEANDLIAKLQQNNVAISPQDIQTKFSQIKSTLANSPFITGEGAAAADKVINGALYKINANSQTASGLLQARKDFDGWVTSLKGAKTFNPTLDSPITMAVQQVRQGINDMVDSAVPSADVKSSLRMQSNLYHAMDNIAPKGATEPATRIGRIADKVTNLIPHSSVGRIAEMIGGASLIHDPGLVTDHPVAFGVPLAGYGLYKATKAPITRIGIGKTLQTIGKAANAISQ